MNTDTFQLHPQLSQDCLHIKDLELCTVLLMNERQFPWIILVPRSFDLTEICQLTEQQQRQYQQESNLISKTLLRQYPNAKLNIANLGNMVPQLHIHHVARFKDDACWPTPIWGNFSPSPYSEKEKSETIELWRSWLLE